MGSRTAKAFQKIDERGFCELYLSETSNVSQMIQLNLTDS
jgi:hypothetical protein